MGWMDGRACVALRGRACASGRVLSCVCACSCVRGRAFGRACTRGVCVCVCVFVRAWSRARARVQCVFARGRAWEDDHTHTHAPPTTVDATGQFCAPQVIAEDHRGRSCGRILRARGAARAAARDWRRHRGLKKTLSSSSSAIVCATSDHARTTSHARQRTTTHDHAHTTPFPPAGVARPTPSPTDGVPRTHRSPCNDYRITNDSQYWNWAFQKVGAQLSRT